MSRSSRRSCPDLVSSKKFYTERGVGFRAAEKKEIHVAKDGSAISGASADRPVKARDVVGAIRSALDGEGLVGSVARR